LATIVQLEAARHKRLSKQETTNDNALFLTVNIPSKYYDEIDLAMCANALSVKTLGVNNAAA